jgi:hypothetical protein
MHTYSPKRCKFSKEEQKARELQFNKSIQAMFYKCIHIHTCIHTYIQPKEVRFSKEEQKARELQFNKGIQVLGFVGTSEVRPEINGMHALLYVCIHVSYLYIQAYA